MLEGKPAISMCVVVAYGAVFGDERVFVFGICRQCQAEGGDERKKSDHGAIIDTEDAASCHENVRKNWCSFSGFV